MSEPAGHVTRDAPVTVAGVVLAAGQASRMGSSGHKLLARFEGVPLVRRVTGAAVASRLSSVIVVTGHRAAHVAEALGGLPVQIVPNPDFASGMATSIAAGARAAGDAAGAMILLADMPDVTTDMIDRLIDAFSAYRGMRIVRAADGQQPGHPVILPRSVLGDTAALCGDTGARQIIVQSGLPVELVDIGPAALLDVDTAEAVMAAGGILTRQ